MKRNVSRRKMLPPAEVVEKVKVEKMTNRVLGARLWFTFSLVRC